MKREADKSYKLGPNRVYSALAIEVAVTSGGIDKLKAYERLKIPEVWFWQSGEIAMYYLRVMDEASIYEQVQSSELLPDLDMALLLKCLTIANHVEAVRTFQQSILP